MAVVRKMHGKSAPGMWSLVLVGLVTLCVLEDISRLVSLQASTSILAPVFALIAMGNYVYHLAKCSASRSSPEEGESSSGGIWRWFILPIGLVLVVSALIEPWPMTLRFSLSQRAFERKVEEMLGTRANQGAQRVGLYWIDGADVGPGDYVRFFTGVSIIDPVGFAYDPKRPPSSNMNRHITGNWYAREW